MILTKEQIKAADDLPRVSVLIKEWGGTVILRGLTAADAFAMAENGADKELAIQLIAKMAIDEIGNRLFSDDEADLAIIRGKSQTAITQLFQEALKLNGRGKAASKELEKN